jgi:hypothetical protein
LPDPVENECLIVNENIKLMARNTEDKPRSIIKKAQIIVSKEAAAQLKRQGPSTQIINRNAQPQNVVDQIQIV